MRLSYEQINAFIRLAEESPEVTCFGFSVHDIADTIKELQQCNQKSLLLAAITNEAIERIFKECKDVQTWLAFKRADTVLSDAADYHNPADVELLRKAREWLNRIADVYWNDLTKEAQEGIEQAISEINKAIGGKEDGENP